MNSYDALNSVVLEVFMRLCIFFPATSLVKMAIDLENPEPSKEITIRNIYILSIITHQLANCDEISIRTLNRLLMCTAITLFCLTIRSSQPCEDMKKFKRKIQQRLELDYFLWCLLFAMDLVLTYSSSFRINLEFAYGVDFHMFHILLSSFTIVHLSRLMRITGNGKLMPLVAGTPMLFLDAGSDITVVKSFLLLLCYICFWCSDWRELVDWNHSMMCDAGICKLLNTENGTLRSVELLARSKFDEWRFEEGLDDDGWFILLEPPSTRSTSNVVRINNGEQGSTNEEDSNGNNETSDETNREGAQHQGTWTDTEAATGDEQGSEIEDNEYQHQTYAADQQLIDYTDRVIYLQSRNPLLTSLAAIMLVLWK